MTGLVIVAARAKSFRSSLVLASLAGAAMWVFDWWYSKPFFGWAFLVGFIWLSLVCHSDIKRIILQSALFLILSGLPFKGLGVSGDSAYLVDVFSLQGMIFPNTFDTISEVSRVSFSDVLTRISGSLLVGTISLIGLGLWGLRHPAYAIVFGPAAAFALLNFVIGNRAIFYSAPMLWFGFGWLMFVLARWFEFRFNFIKQRFVVISICIITSFLSIWVASPTDFLQAPTFDKKIVAHFKELKKALPAENAIVVSWWDYGYMSMFVNGYPTLHDGGAHSSPATYLIANNLLKRSQKTSAVEFQVLADRGYNGVFQMRQQAKAAVNNAVSLQKKTPLYLVLTADMKKWMPSISKIGSFDLKAGKLKKFEGVKADYLLNYYNLKCQSTDAASRFLCDDKNLNLKTGQFGDNVILFGASVAKDGQKTVVRRFPSANSPFILHSEIGKSAKGNVVIHKDLYFSLFHQLFYLNKADPNYFTLVYDGFPDMRVFKIF